MGKKDDFTANMMECDRYFADAFNCVLFNGRCMVSPSDLRPHSERKANTGKNRKGQTVTEKKLRDVIKEVRGNNVTGLLACIAGVENQSDLSRIMPARVMCYDGTEYINQGKKMISSVKEELLGMPPDSFLIPVITIVINFSDKKWDQPRSIHELIYPEYTDADIMRFVPDYFINILDPYDLDDSEIDKMQSNLREVMYVVKYSSDRDKLFSIVNSDSRFTNLDAETKNFLEYYGRITIPENEQGGYNMCKAIQELKDEITSETMRADSMCKAIQELKDEVASETMRADSEAKRADSMSRAVKNLKDEITSETRRADTAEAELAKYIAAYGVLS